MIQEVVGGVTPLKHSVWETALQDHPDKEFVHYITSGLQFGFRIGFDHGRPLRRATCNMLSATQHPEPITEYIEKELQLGRMLGPLSVGGMLQSSIQ